MSDDRSIGRPMRPDVPSVLNVRTSQNEDFNGPRSHEALGGHLGTKFHPTQKGCETHVLRHCSSTPVAPSNLTPSLDTKTHQRRKPYLPHSVPHPARPLLGWQGGQVFALLPASASSNPLHYNNTGGHITSPQLGLRHENDHILAI